MLFVLVIAFFAAVTQSLTGFGLALIAMPLLTQALGVEIAAPMVALMTISTQITLLLRYRSELNFQTVWRLSATSLIGVPLGVYGLQRVDEQIGLLILGIIIIGYSIYALLNFELPEVEGPRWAYGFGFVAGLLSGAFNTPGPAVVIYGNCRRWEPKTFKSNLQGFFLLNSTMVIIIHLLSHHYTEDVWNHFFQAAPAMALGLLAGIYLDRYINPATFRALVLALLILVGLNLIITQL